MAERFRCEMTQKTAPIIDLTASRLRPSIIAAVAIAGLALAILIALRTSPEHVRAAQYWRAFLGRGAVAAFAAGALACGLAALWFVFISPGGEPPRFGVIAIFAASAGFLLQALGTLALARVFDAGLLSAIDNVRHQNGVIRIETEDRRPASLRPRGADGYDRLEPVRDVTPREIALLCAAEDARCEDRASTVDTRAIARALASWAKQGRTSEDSVSGASGIAEQLAGMLLDLKPRSGGRFNLRTKVAKMLAGYRVADLLGSTRDIARLYLQVAPFGSICGHEAEGIASASIAFYGRDHADLTPAQTVELLCHLKNPNLYFPYARPAEGLNDPGHRERRLRARFDAILEAAARTGTLTKTETAAARDSYEAGLEASEAAAAALGNPAFDRIVKEVRERVSDQPRRFLIAITHERVDLQRDLDEAASTITKNLERRLARVALPNDRIKVDAEAIDSGGGVLAETGLAATPDGMASNMKSELYGLGFDLRLLHSPNDRVPGTRLTVRAAVAHSINDAARKLALAIGISRVADFYRSQGYVVTGDYRDIAIGSGVAGSPRLMAGNFVKYTFDSPGIRVYPDRLVRLIDGNTGAILFEPERRRVFSESTGAMARSVFQAVSIEGTAAAALRKLALVSPIAAKTGTVGYFKGHGGSLCVAADSATHITIAVRVRWDSGHPLETDGGHSAAMVIGGFLRSARVFNQEVRTKQ